ncbi:PqqD family protein [Leifsonia sp. TF02-11]|uniref:PqqD family protein n=1 Tax=Leifsonia sp. TF02-11 TaxID=2815212 RepID=UPI001AA0F36F|nr:PqqD family protein [Leifsonia sp. TF02-11]MBO1739303.1 PqqD family protein [Leifsonia sp. TF02-11]
MTDAETTTDRIRAGVVFRRTPDGGIVLDKRSGAYSQVNSSAADVIEGLIDGLTRDEIAHAITGRYEAADLAIVRSDVDALVAQLREVGIVAR